MTHKQQPRPRCPALSHTPFRASALNVQTHYILLHTFSSPISSDLATSLSPVAQANEPAAIRNGDAAAKNAYQVGTSFEQVLLDQLTQELASTDSDPSSDGSNLAVKSRPSVKIRRESRMFSTRMCVVPGVTMNSVWP